MEQIQLPNTAAQDADLRAFITEAKNFKVTTQIEYDVALGFIKDIKNKKRMVEDTYRQVKASAAKTHKDICALEAARWKPLDDIERTLKRVMSDYLQAEERKRREEERALQERARQEAEQETLHQAIEAEKHLGTDAADAILEAPVVAPVISIEKVDKGQGVIQRKTYAAEVTDFLALVRAVAAGEAPLACLAADTKFLNNQARALKEELKYPGVRLVIQNDLAIKTGS